MNYNFLSNSVDLEHLLLPNSEIINPFLLKNNRSEIEKGLRFLNSKEKLFHVHGFLGSGKRQLINYVAEFLSKDVIKLEYYCKEATVCDDILLSFTELIDKNVLSKAININSKITTLNIKFLQQVSSIKKPFLIILHSFDDILKDNSGLVANILCELAKEENVKIIISTRGMLLNDLDEIKDISKVLIKNFSKEIFKEFLSSYEIDVSSATLEDFYKYTRGYYYYTILTLKIVKAMNISLNDFLQKYLQSGMNYDSFLSVTYINIIPTAIRNFFWFLRTIRHGISLNALAELEIYDETSVNYLINNLMIFQTNETLYVQDYFLQDIDISIPRKVEIKLHKYIIGIYEKCLIEPIKSSSIMLSRQALRAEIDYHHSCIDALENKNEEPNIEKEVATKESEHSNTSIKVVQQKNDVQSSVEDSLQKEMSHAKSLFIEKKYTDAIEAFLKILDTNNITLQSVVEIRLNLAKIYKEIAEYKNAEHYYELVETYYKQHNESINLCYLYYDMTDLYYKMYKHERAIETIKKVIYSVETPQELLVNACTLLGNIYSDINDAENAYNYYKKALESLNSEVNSTILAELYFKYALACDDKGDMNSAFDYYNKCTSITKRNPYLALAYSNLASCYYENYSYDDAIACFQKAYNIETSNNNFDGIYYNAKHLAKIYLKINPKKAYKFLMEAKKSADFLNEPAYMLDAAIDLGDYYYNLPKNAKECLIEYFKARKLSESLSLDISKIDGRIADMKIRMKEEDFKEIENKYA